jgi:hypothetical protein
MLYEIQSDTMMFEIDRTAIVDISVGDDLRPKGFSKGLYTWTQQDSQFMESNPDARVFLKVRKTTGNDYKGIGIMVIPEE